MLYTAEGIPRHVGTLLTTFLGRHELATGVRPATDVLGLVHAVQPVVLRQRIPCNNPGSLAKRWSPVAV